MTRRLTPFNESTFKVTIKKPSNGKLEDSITFHENGLGRTRSRFMEECGRMGFYTGSLALSLEENWDFAEVNDPNGGVFNDESVSFVGEYENFSVTAERILTFQESVQSDVTRIVYIDGYDNDVQLSFEQKDSEQESVLFVKVRVAGNGNTITIKCQNKHLVSNLTVLGSLVGSTVDQGIDWEDTEDVGALVE